MKKIKKKNSPEMSIFKYIRDNKGRIKGLMVGFAIIDGKRNNHFAIGYSLCNPKDSFDMETAVNLCYRRGSGYLSERIPQSIRKDLSCFADRCRSYFQGKMLVSSFPVRDFYFLEFFKILPKDFKDKWFHESVQVTGEKKIATEVFYCREFNTALNCTSEEFEYRQPPYAPSLKRVISSDFEFKNCVKEEPKGTGSYIKLTIEYVE